VNRFFLIFFMVIISTLLYSQAEESDNSNEVYSSNPEIDSLLDNALSFADEGLWESALDSLDKARRIDPSDPRIASYRSSILELSALDKAQQSWSDGVSAEVETVESNNGQETVEDGDTPKFVIDRGDDDKRNPPSLYRDNLRLDLGIKTFAVNPLSSETMNTWSSSNEFFYTSIRADFRYWMPFLGKSIGFNFRSNGYSWAPGEPDILFNALDLGVNLRGFLLENEFSRLELGLDFGGSMLTTNEKDKSLDHNWAMYLGLWVADPLFFHIFKVESLERLVFSGGIRIYSSNEEEILETVNFRVDTAWYFKRGFSGIRFEWWDFTADTGAVNMMSFSLFGGFRY